MTADNQLRLIYTGDWHLRGNNPRNRTDDYMAAADAKLCEVFQLARAFDADALIMPGDVWDRPEVAIGVLLHYADLLTASPTPIYATVGNHDIYGYNLSSYPRTSLKLLELLVPQLHVLYQSDDLVPLKSAQLTAAAYTGRMDIDGYGYSPEVPAADGVFSVHVAHGMLLDHTPPFDRYSLVQSVKTTANLVLTGHDHLGYGVWRRPDGVVFVNPGALLRMSASVSEMERPVQVAQIAVDLTTAAVTVDLVPLKAAAPGDQVLDRSRLEEQVQRQYAMQSFSALIQTHTGGRALVDINQIVETIADAEGYEPEVVKTALAVIDQQREHTKGA